MLEGGLNKDLEATSISCRMAGDNGNSEEKSIPLVNGGVPTYGEDPITAAEDFLQKYKESLTQKLETIDKELKEMDKKARAVLSIIF